MQMTHAVDSLEAAATTTEVSATTTKTKDARLKIALIALAFTACVAGFAAGVFVAVGGDDNKGKEVDAEFVGTVVLDGKYGEYLHGSAIENGMSKIQSFLDDPAAPPLNEYHANITFNLTTAGAQLAEGTAALAPQQVEASVTLMNVSDVLRSHGVDNVQVNETTGTVRLADAESKLVVVKNETSGEELLYLCQGENCTLAELVQSESAAGHGRRMCGDEPTSETRTCNHGDNVLTENAQGVGGWGGSCTCPDGSVYFVGDNIDYCGSLACTGGQQATCNRYGGVWSGHKVTCGPAPVETPAQRCHRECESLGFCCNDFNVGSNQYLSCAQGCMIRARGTYLGECMGVCDAQDASRGCFRTVNGHEYSMCQTCSDLDATCPHGVPYDQAACQTGCQLNPGFNEVEAGAAGVGGWGGTCICPDGSSEWAGDNIDACGSLACVGGSPGECHRYGGPWSHKRATCGQANGVQKVLGYSQAQAAGVNAVPHGGESQEVWYTGPDQQQGHRSVPIAPIPDSAMANQVVRQVGRTMSPTFRRSVARMVTRFGFVLIRLGGPAALQGSVAAATAAGLLVPIAFTGIVVMVIMGVQQNIQNNIEQNGCLPADALVTAMLAAHAPPTVMPIAHVPHGSMVLSTAGFSPIYLYSHYTEKALTTMARIETRSGHGVELSPGHYLRACSAQHECAFTQAQHVAQGMHVELLATNGTVVTSLVTSSGLVEKQGLYNPHTLAGDVVVASANATAANDLHGLVVSDASEWFAEGYVPEAYIPALYHAVLAPVRQLYRLNPAWGTRFHERTIALLESKADAKDVRSRAVAGSLDTLGSTELAKSAVLTGVASLSNVLGAIKL